MRPVLSPLPHLLLPPARYSSLPRTLLICQGGPDQFRRFSESHSFAAALSPCQTSPSPSPRSSIVLQPHSWAAASVPLRRLPRLSSVVFFFSSSSAAPLCLSFCPRRVRCLSGWIVLRRREGGRGEGSGVTCLEANFWGFPALVRGHSHTHTHAQTK